MKRIILLTIILITLYGVMAFPEEENVMLSNAKISGTLIDGITNASYKIYDASSGGTLIFEQNFTSVNFSNGVAYLNVNASKSALDYNTDYWRELTLNSTSYNRMKIGSVPSAYLANSSRGDTYDYVVAADGTGHSTDIADCMGKNCFVKEGDYIVNSALAVTDNTTITGSGYETRVIANFTTITKLFNIANSPVKSNIKITNLHIDGQSKSIPVSEALYCHECTNTEFSDIWVTGWNSTGVKFQGNAYDVKLSNYVFKDSITTGVYIIGTDKTNFPHNIEIDGVRCEYITHTTAGDSVCIGSEYAEDVNINNVDCQDMDFCLWMTPYNYRFNVNNLVSNNTLAEGIRVSTESYDVNVQNCLIKNSNEHGLMVLGSKRVNIDNCISNSNNKSGFRVLNSEYVNINGVAYDNDENGFTVAGSNYTYIYGDAINNSVYGLQEVATSSNNFYDIVHCTDNSACYTGIGTSSVIKDFTSAVMTYYAGSLLTYKFMSGNNADAVLGLYCDDGGSGCEWDLRTKANINTFQIRENDIPIMEIEGNGNMNISGDIVASGVINATGLFVTGELYDDGTALSSKYADVSGDTFTGDVVASTMLNATAINLFNSGGLATLSVRAGNNADALFNLYSDAGDDANDRFQIISKANAGNTQFRYNSVPVMELDNAGNLNVSGNITATGRIFQQTDFPHMFGLCNQIQSVASGGVWYNITFNSTISEIEGNLIFDANNELLTIVEDGDYLITFAVGIKDSSASPDANVAIRIAKNGVQLEGSYAETDTTKQNADQYLTRTTYAGLSAGDKLVMQYISDDTTVTIDTGGTYDTGYKIVASGWLQKID